MKRNILLLLTLGLFSAITITSCVKGEFDTPPITIPTFDGTANMTIAELKAKYVGVLDSIEDNYIIAGKVVGNDESGNLYKKIIIQDATAGIEILLNRKNMYTEFKLGQKVFVKCQGLYLGEYNGLIQLGAKYNGSTGQIADVYINNHLFRDSLPGSVPEAVTITTTPDPKYVSSLVKLENVHFAQAGEVYATQDASATNRDLLDATGKKIIVRTSQYATFAGLPMPAGVGTVYGILSVFGSDYQLTIRDTNDVKGFSGTVPPPPTGEYVYPAAGLTAVAEFTENFDGAVDNTDIAINSWTVKAASGTRNWQGKTFQTEKYAQATSYNSSDDANISWIVSPPVTYNANLKLSFKSALAYYVHDGLSVYILTGFDGTTGNWSKINATLPTSATANHTWVESGDINLSDYVTSGYSGNIYIGFKYSGTKTNTTTFKIDDVKVSTTGGGGGGGGVVFQEDFATTLGTFSAHNVSGTEAWVYATFDNGCAKMTGYANSTNNPNEDWLISPAINLSGHAGTILTLRQAAKYVYDQWTNIQVLVSDDYDGTSDPTEQGTWEVLTVPTMPTGLDFNFVDSGEIDLGDYDGSNKVYVAFRYLSSSTNACTWEIGQVIVK
jgi:hypothetical protein